MRRNRNSLKSKSELGRKLAKIRWAQERARKDLEEPARKMEMELARVIGEGPIALGQYVGTLQWSDNSGKVRRWIVRRGMRSGQIIIDGVAQPKTTTWLLDRLRRHLASYFRTGRE